MPRVLPLKRDSGNDYGLELVLTGPLSWLLPSQAVGVLAVAARLDHPHACGPDLRHRNHNDILATPGSIKAT